MHQAIIELIVNIYSGKFLANSINRSCSSAVISVFNARARFPFNPNSQQLF